MSLLSHLPPQSQGLGVGTRRPLPPAMPPQPQPNVAPMPTGQTGGQSSAANRQSVGGQGFTAPFTPSAPSAFSSAMMAQGLKSPWGG